MYRMSLYEVRRILHMCVVLLIRISLKTITTYRIPERIIRFTLILYHFHLILSLKEFSN